MNCHMASRNFVRQGSTQLSRLVLNRPLLQSTFSTSSWAFTASTIPPHDQTKKEQIKDRRFSSLTNSDIAKFKSILLSSDTNAVIHGPPHSADLLPYNQDWMKRYVGKSSCVLKPKTTDQVAKILAYCNIRRLAIVPQGGNTGLVGGGVPVHDEVILSLSRMNEIQSFDSVSGIVVCQAGVILERLDDWLGARGFMCPLDLGAKGSCHIGGNIATNAGGLRLLRYGSLHGSVLGLEVVLANGQILNTLSSLRKDNTGTDLKQLFIGSEGTLGIITAVSLLTPPKPRSTQVAILGVESFAQVQKTFVAAKAALSDILSAFEFWDGAAHALVREQLSLRDPLTQPAPFYVLIETHSSTTNGQDAEQLAEFLESVDMIDGALAQDSSQAKGIWHIREGIPLACGQKGAVYKYDISIPVPELYNMVHDVKERLKQLGLFGSKVTDVIGYGHIGDGNLHLNITCPAYDPQVSAALEPFVYEWTRQHHGSISAEHGLGVMKAPYIAYSKSPEAIYWMRQIKKTFDPHGILNPYKFVDEHV